MKFTYENINQLEDNLHDCLFDGYLYDYEKRQIRLSCVDEWAQGKREHLTFDNVIYSEMQSCEFWSPSPHVYAMWIEEQREDCGIKIWEEKE